MVNIVRLSLVKDNKFLRVDSLINGTSPYKTKTLESSEIESNDDLTASGVHWYSLKVALGN